MVHGRHLLIDMYGIAEEILRDSPALLATLEKVVSATGLHAVAPPTVVQFTGRGAGATGFIALAESHIAFHSYPEFGYLAVDLFTCGDADASGAQRIFEADLRPAHVISRLCYRGSAE